jgi:hypothetical protein
MSSTQGGPLTPDEVGASLAATALPGALSLTAELRPVRRMRFRTVASGSGSDGARPRSALVFLSGLRDSVVDVCLMQPEGLRPEGDVLRWATH